MNNYINNQLKKLHIFTIATKENHHLDRLIRSAKAHNVNLNIFGMGETYKGHGKKRILMHRYLSQYDPNDVFMYVDAYDVIFLAGEDEMYQKYKQYYNNQLVFGAEQNLGMYRIDDIYYFLKYPIKNKQFKYLNAGTVMGPIKKGLELFEFFGLDNEEEKCDQIPLIQYFTKFPNRLTVDTEHHIFGVNGGRAGLETSDYQLKDHRLYSTKTNSLPTLLHVPGKFFVGLDQIAIQLGYMDKAPEYTKEEKLAYKAAKRDHEYCERLGIENYVFRLIKNWTINIGILLIVILIFQLLSSFKYKI